MQVCADCLIRTRGILCCLRRSLSAAIREPQRARRTASGIYGRRIVLCEMKRGAAGCGRDLVAKSRIHKLRASFTGPELNVQSMVMYGLSASCRCFCVHCVDSTVRAQRIAPSHVWREALRRLGLRHLRRRLRQRMADTSVVREFTRDCILVKIGADGEIRL